MEHSAARYDERLTAPRSWWVIAALVALSGGLVALPLGPVPLLGGLLAGGLLAAVAVSSYGSARIRVVAGSLVAGDARIPVTALGAAEVLDAEEARAWRMHKADPRAFMLLRGYIPTALRVEITDTADPTPYAYLSTRNPRALAAALEAARDSQGDKGSRADADTGTGEGIRGGEETGTGQSTVPLGEGTTISESTAGRPG